MIYDREATPEVATASEGIRLCGEEMERGYSLLVHGVNKFFI